MNLDVYPLAISTVDWPTYIRVYQELIGKSPCALLDANFMKPDNLGSFVATLAQDRDPRQALRNGNSILRHVQASFILGADDNVIITLTGMGLCAHTHFSHMGNLTFISGDILIWKQTILEMCQADYTYHVRVILNKCCLYIEKAGLDIFSGYDKTKISDKTFILEEK